MLGVPDYVIHSLSASLSRCPPPREKQSNRQERPVPNSNSYPRLRQRTAGHWRFISGPADESADWISMIGNLRLLIEEISWVQIASNVTSSSTRHHVSSRSAGTSRRARSPPIETRRLLSSLSHLKASRRGCIWSRVAFECWIDRMMKRPPTLTSTAADGTSFSPSSSNTHRHSTVHPRGDAADAR